MFMGCAGVSTVGGHNLVSLPKVIRLQLGDNCVLRLPTDILTLFREENRFANLKAPTRRHDHSPIVTPEYLKGLSVPSAKRSPHMWVLLASNTPKWRHNIYISSGILHVKNNSMLGPFSS
jgi:hypothetical protein